MQIDMHFYGTYAVARIAGFSPELAKTIATAAQFVDEAVSATPIELGEQSYLLPVVSAHEMLEVGKNFDKMDQWKVWLPFHFLPGGVGDTIDERLVCLWGEPGNRAVDAIVQLALDAGAAGKPYAYHLLGIVSHVIQDTYAHYGFSGMASDANEIDQTTLTHLNVNRLGEYIEKKTESFKDRLEGSFAEATQLGHAAVTTCPDRPYLVWQFEYDKAPNIDVDYLHQAHDNQKTFFMACTRLHAVYDAFFNGRTSIDAGGGHLPFEKSVEEIIRMVLAHEGKKDERGEKWRSVLNDRSLLENDASTEDMHLYYNSKGWGIRAMQDNPLASTTDAYHYNIAASNYLNKIHDEILPGMGILIK